jgi:hypothetical protein
MSLKKDQEHSSQLKTWAVNVVTQIQIWDGGEVFIGSVERSKWNAKSGSCKRASRVTVV